MRSDTETVQLSNTYPKLMFVLFNYATVLIFRLKIKSGLTIEMP